jgi:hypothetical protein
MIGGEVDVGRLRLVAHRQRQCGRLCLLEGLGYHKRDWPAGERNLLGLQRLQASVRAEERDARPRVEPGCIGVVEDSEDAWHVEDR